MKNNERKYLERHQENEAISLNTDDIIHLYDSGHPKKKDDLKKIYFILCILILIFIINFSFYYLNYQGSNNIHYLEENNNNNSTKKEKIKIIAKNVTNKDGLIVNETIEKKIGIVFWFQNFSHFIVNAGEYLLLSEKYKIYFLGNKEKGLKFNKGIKTINIFSKNVLNHTLIENFIKEEKIIYMITNQFTDSKKDIKWLKTLGIKIIGFFDENNINKKGKLLDFYNAFVFDSPHDYIFYKKLNYKQNIFIPKIYKTPITPLNNTNNHNIFFFGKLDDKKNGIFDLIKDMQSIFKQFPDTKLNIYSPNKQTEKLGKLIKKLKLQKKINFIPLKEEKEKLFYLKNSSILIYESTIEEYQNTLMESISYGLSCLTTADVSKYFFKANITNEKIGDKILKIFKEEKYRKKAEEDSKENLNKYNDEIVKLWEKLFVSLNNGEFKKLKNEIEKKYLKEKKLI